MYGSYQLLQLRMYEEDGKLSNGINKKYVNSLICVRVKGSENKSFKSHVRQCRSCVLPFNVYIDDVIKKIKIGVGRIGERLQRV